MKITSIIEHGAGTIRSRAAITPEIGLILGSGLGDYAAQLEDKVIIPYSDIEGFPISTVPGHAGQFVLGKRNGVNLIVMQGRVHYYEGYSQDLITLPIRIMKQLGVSNIVLTNSAGGVNTDYLPGDLMLIKDHINFSGSNPLLGENLEQFGPRFPDMSCIYPEACRQQLMVAMQSKGITLQEGTYMMFSGPCYETPAEVRMARIMGADAVGMSTVPEAIVCAHCSIPVIGITCITNMAAGILNQPLNHAEVVDIANKVKGKFTQVIDAILENNKRKSV